MRREEQQASPLPPVEEYLRTVSEQVRWEGARPALVEELRTHLLDEVDARMLDGMTAAEAEAEALRRMGDPVEVGQALDEVHRPDAQWPALVAFALLAAIGAAAQAYCGVAADMWWVGAPKTAAFALLGVAAMAAFHLADCQGLLARRAPLLAGAAVGSACLVALACDATSAMAQAAYSYHNVTLAFPLLFSLLLYRCRGLRWKGFGACVVTGAAMAALAAFFGGAPQLFAVGASTIALVAYTSAVGWLGVSGLRPLFALAVAAVGVSALFLSTGMLEEWCGWIPMGDLVPNLSATTSDYALIAMSSTFGAAPVMLLCFSVLALSVWLATRSARQANRLCAMVGTAVAIALACSALTAMAPLVLGIVLPGNAFPFLTPGLHSAVLMAQIGVALSGLRHRRRPGGEAAGAAKRDRSIA